MQIEYLSDATRGTRQTRLQLAERKTRGPTRKRRETIRRRPVWRGLNLEKINLAIRGEVKGHWFTADESHGRDGVRTFTELAEQKRIRVHAYRLIFSFSGTQDQLAFAAGTRVRLLQLQEIA